MIKSHGLGYLPEVFNRSDGRQEVKRLTGSTMVPVLVTDDGEVVTESQRIVEWTSEHPAAAPAAAAT